ncbi:MAG: efflux RND transporter periplasmic adaptor subunit [Pseudomonadota bacterium]
MLRTPPFVLVFVLVLGVAVSTARAQQDAPPPAVTTAPVTAKHLSFGDVFTGRIEAEQHVDIRARVAGFIQSIGFTEGQNVAQGDVLFEIEPDAYQAAIQQIEGQIDSAEAEAKLAAIELDRQRKLLSTNVAAEVTVQQAEAQAGKIAGQILQLEGALKDAKLDLSYTKITAPFDGRVGLTEIDIGAFVGASSAPLVSLSSIDPIYVTFPVPEAVLLDVRKRHLDDTGATLPPNATITLANGDPYEEPGKVEVVDTIVQPGTDTILIRASFPNPDGVLRDGQLVTIEIVEDNPETSLTFPVQALQREQAGYFVYTVDPDDTAQKTEIKVDRVDGTDVVVASGLKEGDQIIVDGIQKVRPGERVQVTPSEDQATSQ